MLREQIVKDALVYAVAPHYRSDHPELAALEKVARRKNRKTWLFCGHDEGARRAADLFARKPV